PTLLSTLLPYTTLFRSEVQGDYNKRPRPSVDLLFSSAAEVYGERLIAVILTGSGSDGAAGAVDVKNAGGTVIVQDPQTARYPSRSEEHTSELQSLAYLV